MMQMDWKKELGVRQSWWEWCGVGGVDVHVAAKQLDLQRDDGFAEPDGGEDAAEDERALVFSGVQAQEEGEEKAEQQRAPAHVISDRRDLECFSRHIPKIPIPQSLGHPTLQHRIRIRQPSSHPANMAHGARKPTAHQPLPLLASASASTSLQSTTSIQQRIKQVLRIQHLPHLLPHRQQIPPQRVPDALVDGVDRGAPVFALDGGVEVALRAACRAGVGLRLRVGDAPGERGAVCCARRVFQFV